MCVHRQRREAEHPHPWKNKTRSSGSRPVGQSEPSWSQFLWPGQRRVCPTNGTSNAYRDPGWYPLQTCNLQEQKKSINMNSCYSGCKSRCEIIKDIWEKYQLLDEKGGWSSVFIMQTFSPLGEMWEDLIDPVITFSQWQHEFHVQQGDFLLPWQAILWARKNWFLPSAYITQPCSSTSHVLLSYTFRIMSRPAPHFFFFDKVTNVKEIQDEHHCCSFRVLLFARCPVLDTSFWFNHRETQNR